jgi:hypothetical protein
MLAECLVEGMNGFSFNDSMAQSKASTKASLVVPEHASHRLIA